MHTCCTDVCKLHFVSDVDSHSISYNFCDSFLCELKVPKEILYQNSLSRQLSVSCDHFFSSFDNSSISSHQLVW